jgi:SPP1 gp7 family putative phage head morphogenesis protein
MSLFVCPHCRQQIDLKEVAGISVECPGCRKTLTLVRKPKPVAEQPSVLDVVPVKVAKFSASDLNSKEAVPSILFPGPRVEQLEALMSNPRMGGVAWRDQIEFASKLAPPEKLMSILAQGVTAGKMPREIAKDLLPLVQGNRESAMQIATTGCMRVAKQVREEASRSIEAMIAGKMIVALFDIVTRPLHRARHGLIWYKDSGTDMQTALRMEGPTLPDGLECRCFLSDVMKTPSWVNNQKKMEFFRSRADKLSPENAVYSDWFAKQDERMQRLAVGTGRYSAVKEALDGGAMHYEHFIDSVGNLLSVDAIRAESHTDRLTRVTDLQEETATRRQTVRDLSTFGFLPPETTPPIPAGPVLTLNTKHRQG